MCDNCKLPVTWTWCQGIDISTCSCTAGSQIQPGPVCLPSQAPPGWEGRAGGVFLLNLYPMLMAFRGENPTQSQVCTPPLWLASHWVAVLCVYVHTNNGGPFLGVLWTWVCFAPSVKPQWCPGQKAGEERCFSFEEGGELLHLHGPVWSSAAKEGECPNVTPSTGLPHCPSCPSLFCVCLAWSPEEQRSLLLIVMEQKWHKTPPCSLLLP